MLRVFTKTSKLREALEGQADIGFVPTMGNLHEGHISLLAQSCKNHSLSVISIFVNPTQFSKDEDFSSYPRTLQDDLNKIEQALSKYDIIVFAPESSIEIYPNGTDKLFIVKGPKAVLEGSLRPEHFDGVTTVVKNFFDIIKPQKAYFGKKDYQQFILIKQLVDQFALNVEVIGMPIVREASGLAMSSRNNYLSSTEKEQALKLWQTLLELKTNLCHSKNLNEANETIDKITKEDDKFNYLEIRNKNTLEKATSFNENLVILGNMQVNKTRLLDNLEIVDEKSD